MSPSTFPEDRTEDLHHRAACVSYQRCAFRAWPSTCAGTRAVRTVAHWFCCSTASPTRAYCHYLPFLPEHLVSFQRLPATARLIRTFTFAPPACITLVVPTAPFMDGNTIRPATYSLPDKFSVYSFLRNCVRLPLPVRYLVPPCGVPRGGTLPDEQVYYWLRRARCQRLKVVYANLPLLPAIYYLRPF
jgi:hypothetical protein